MSVPDYAGDVTPQEAWKRLAEDPRAKLIDVRTLPEWAFVGVPDLKSLDKRPLFVSWQIYPNMQQNPEFVELVKSSGVEQDDPLFFICRSGGRSRMAAVAMTARGFSECYNVAGGFEGDHDGDGHRGNKAGWKVENLPWAQD